MEFYLKFLQLKSAPYFFGYMYKSVFHITRSLTCIRKYVVSIAELAKRIHCFRGHFDNIATQTHWSSYLTKLFDVLSCECFYRFTLKKPHSLIRFLDINKGLSTFENVWLMTQKSCKLWVLCHMLWMQVPPEFIVTNDWASCGIWASAVNGQFMMTSSNGNIFRVTGPLCGEFTGPGEFPTQWPVTRSFDVFFDLCLNKRLSKQPWGWWFETPLWSLWRQCNAMTYFH